MKKFAIVALAFAASASFAATKTYQVTGPVLEASDTKLVIQKGDEKWEIAKDASTKVKGELKVGAKATVKYTMTATDIDVKSK
ncbi:MAG: hypothetical protein ACJ763_15840 [Bdellovibrionia bacterium]